MVVVMPSVCTTGTSTSRATVKDCASYAAIDDVDVPFVVVCGSAFAGTASVRDEVTAMAGASRIAARLAFAARRTCRGSAARSARSAAERESTAAPATAVEATGRGAASATVRAAFAGWTKEERATAGPRAARRPRGRRGSVAATAPGADDSAATDPRAGDSTPSGPRSAGSGAADRAPSWAAGSACRPMVPSGADDGAVDRLGKITYWSRTCVRLGRTARFLRFVSALPDPQGRRPAVSRARGGRGPAPGRRRRRGGPTTRSGCRRAG